MTQGALPAPGIWSYSNRFSEPGSSCSIAEQRARADENGTYRRRPPLPAAVRGWDAVPIEPPCDLSQPASAGVFEDDALDNALRERWWPPRGAPLAIVARWFEVLLEEPLELGDRNQPLTPGRLHRVHARNEATIDRRDADADSLGGLLAAVGEPLDLVHLLQLAGRRPRTLRLGVSPAALSLGASLPSRAHRRRTVIPASDSTCGASVSGLPWVVLFVHVARPPRLGLRGASLGDAVTQAPSR
jgi:hypothetical protein